jgi:hypothetical protein
MEHTHVIFQDRPQRGQLQESRTAQHQVVKNPEVKTRKLMCPGKTGHGIL